MKSSIEPSLARTLEQSYRQSLIKINEKKKEVSKRAALHDPIRLAMRVAYKEFGMRWLTAAQITTLLRDAGVIEHENPRTIGDTLGGHENGMNLPSREIDGKKHYALFTDNGMEFLARILIPVEEAN